MASVCGLLFVSKWSGEHVAAMAAAPAVQAAVLRLLLEHVLPAVVDNLEGAFGGSSGEGSERQRRRSQ